jgi:hypothetical protein
MKRNHQKQPVTQLINHSPVTQLHSDKGIIQIGSDETATDNFILTIFVGQAVNLDLVSYLQCCSNKGFIQQCKHKCKVVPVHAMKTYRGSGSTDSFTAAKEFLVATK